MPAALRSGFLVWVLWAWLSLGLAGCAVQPAPVDALRTQAVAGQAADVATTAAGLALGAAEANPLGLATLGVKAVVAHQIRQAPADEQPGLWSAYGAFGWGAAANNLCVVAAMATGGVSAALCPLLGLAAGMSVWEADKAAREEATFWAICARERERVPGLECVYTARRAD
ncbi:MAG: hypothetical protein JNK17_02160 [Hydrogenophaga sp.]|nr:hypothetical protein [Hydrogenophaga sp.]